MMGESEVKDEEAKKIEGMGIIDQNSEEINFG
jgi:hypothetical protein